MLANESVEAFFSNQKKYFQENNLRSELLEYSKIIEAPKDTLLIDDGSYLKMVPILLFGCIKVIRIEDEKEILLYYIYPNESCIMSISVVLNDQKTGFKAIAEEDCKLLMIPARFLPDWQRNYDSFNLFINDLYKKRFNDLLSAFNSVAFQKMDSRIIEYLNGRAQASETNKIKATHQEIADELGVARETVSRLLKKLEQDGVVKLYRGIIELLK
ncbi:MAG: Crp/Fnr family transcriptional regulator [Bacteroidota bacterium]